MDAILSEYLNSSANKPLVKFCSQYGSDLTETEIDGRIRLTCTSDECNYVFCDSPTPVVAAEESLFIDDRLPNIETAISVGLKTHHYTTVETLESHLVSRGILS